MIIGRTDGGVRLQAQRVEANLDSPPPPSATLCLFPSPSSSPHTSVFRFSSLGEGGMRSPSFVKLVEWLGLVECSSGPGALCRGGRVEHRDLPLQRGCWGGGPLSTKSSLGALGCGDSGLTDGDRVGCGEEGDTGVRGGENGLDEADNDDPRGFRGTCVVICCSLVRLVDWVGRGKL